MQTRIMLASARPLEDPARFAALLETVLPARRRKLERLRNSGAKRLSLGAGLLLREALRAEGLQPADYAETAYGKPYFPSLPDFHFSLSHSGETVMCAVSSQPLGCDVETVRKSDPAIAERFFDPEEKAWLCSLPARERDEAFIRLWTLKESFLKAVGLGLSLPLRDFAVTAGETPVLRQDVDPRPWKLLSFREGECFCALCAVDADKTLPVEHIRFDEVDA